jgi:hypothetical protein
MPSEGVGYQVDHVFPAVPVRQWDFPPVAAGNHPEQRSVAYNRVRSHAATAPSAARNAARPR